MPTPFLFIAPRDAKSPVTERIESPTDVQTSANRTRVRNGACAFPRLSYSYEVLALNPVTVENLKALRLETSFLVPLWPHVFERPDVAPTAGIAANGVSVQLDQFQGAVQTGGFPIAWGEPYGICAPLALARYAGAQRSLNHVRIGRILTTSVSFRLENFKELIAPYTGAMSQGMPLLDVFANNGSQWSESINETADEFDNGHLPLYESLYFTNTLSTKILLRTRQEVVDFRRLVFSLKGRLKPMRWAPPGEPEATFYLAGDAVEIAYYRPSLATCVLTLERA